MAQREVARKWTAADVGDQHGRIAVVTGATSGLGLQTAKVLAGHGSTVVVAGRDAGKTAAAADLVRSAAPGAQVETALLDLASLESVRKAAADLTARFQRLDLLINNAGLMMSPYGLTADGFELQVGTNHLGHFALTGLLLPALLGVRGSRVVTLSSNAHRAGRMDLDNLLSSRRYSRTGAYGRSKLANLMFTYELQRRLSAAGANTIALAAHPGTARTDLTRHLTPLADIVMAPRFAALNSWWVQDAAAGALPALRAATDPAAIGGTYYGPDGFLQFTGDPVVVRSSARSHNGEAQRRLWALSEQLTGVSYPV
jgi:NAD(P)-dependent dehydrogenase (short-subunit alcohol dehydrogenase family)